MLLHIYVASSFSFLLIIYFYRIFIQLFEKFLRINPKKGEQWTKRLLVNIAKLFLVESVTIYILSSDINLTPLSSALTTLSFFKTCYSVLVHDIMNWYYLDYHWASTHPCVSAPTYLLFSIYFCSCLLLRFQKIFFFTCLFFTCGCSA